MDDSLVRQQAEGFVGQRHVVLAPARTARVLARAVCGGVAVARAGHYPQARWHWRQRPRGTGDTVLIYCTAGRGWVRCGPKRFDMRAGTAALLPPGVPHAYGADNDAPWTIHWLHLCGPQIRSLREELGLDAVVHAPGVDARLVEHLEQVLELLLVSHATTALLAATFAAKAALARLSTLRRAARQAPLDSQARVRRVIALLQARPSDRMTLSAMADTARLSVAQFSALFHRTTGQSPQRFRLELRMRRACQLLAQTRLPVKQIAADCGFDDPLYFSRRFTARFACSPTAYRTGVGG